MCASFVRQAAVMCACRSRRDLCASAHHTWCWGRMGRSVQVGHFMCACAVVCMLPTYVLHMQRLCASDVEPFLLVSTKTELLLAPYQPGGSLSWETLQALPFTGTDIQSIQYDPHFNKVFVLDAHAVTALHLGDWTQVCVLLKL